MREQRAQATLKQKFGANVLPSSFHPRRLRWPASVLQDAREPEGQGFRRSRSTCHARGFSWKSPRGPVTIDAATREPIENYYIRRVEKKDGRMQNVVIKTIEGVKPPGVK